MHSRERFLILMDLMMALLVLGPILDPLITIRKLSETVFSDDLFFQLVDNDGHSGRDATAAAGDIANHRHVGAVNGPVGHSFKSS